MNESRYEENCSIGELIHRMLAEINHTSAGDTMAIIFESGLNLPKVVTLNMLAKSCPQTPTAIADRLHLSRAATSHLIDQMVRKGYVTRTENASDRRMKNISITSKGKKLIGNLESSRQAAFDQAAGMLSEELRWEFSRILDLVIKQLSEKHSVSAKEDA